MSVRALSFSGVRKAFGRGGASTRVLEDLSFDLDRGEILGLIGANGAGKSTAIRIGCGLILPDAGRVEVGGLDPAQDPRALRRLGILLEGSRSLYWRLTPLENLEYFGGLKGMAGRVVRERSRCLITRFRLDDKSHVPVQMLSKGMQQRVSIMVAMVNRPEVLFLDEPTLGLDYESSRQMQQHIHEVASEGTAVCVTSHQPEVIRALAGTVIVLKKGRVTYHGSNTGPPRPGGCATRYRIATSANVSGEASTMLRARFPETVVEGRAIDLRCRSADLHAALSFLDPAEIASLRRENEDVVADLFETLS